jgi:hypothetical protein
MTSIPQRWRDLHPGDLIREHWPIKRSHDIAQQLERDGYQFRFYPEPEGSHLVGCVRSPRLLTQDRP